MLVADPASPDFNAYCDLAEAEAYIDTLAFNEAWAGKTDKQKEGALINAATWMDGLDWKGKPINARQPLAWPRAEAIVNGEELPHDEIPKRVKEANAEFAMRLLAEDRAADAEKGVALGSLRTSDTERKLIPDSVKDLVKPYIKAATSVRIARA